MLSSKVIHLITTIERGGAENQLLILAAEQIIQGIDVEVIYLKGKPDLLREFESLKVKVNDLIVNKNFFRQITILRKYFHKNSGFVHTHLPRAEVTAFLSVPKYRYLVSRHNYEQFWPTAPKIISTLISRIVLTRAVGGISISRALKEYLIENREISIKFPMEIVYYGFDKKLKSKKNPTYNISKIFDLPPNIFKIGIISRLVPSKDILTLFRAFQLALLANKNIVLFIVGTGNQEAELFNLTKILRIEKKVFWLGKIKEIPDFLSELDLFVFTSKGEGFGLAILEAMLATKPILAANNSAIPEVLGKKYSGLFTTGDYETLSSKISRVISNPSYSKELIKSYQPQIDLFDPKVMAKSIKQTYELYGF